MGESWRVAGATLVAAPRACKAHWMRRPTHDLTRTPGPALGQGRIRGTGKGGVGVSRRKSGDGMSATSSDRAPSLGTGNRRQPPAQAPPRVAPSRFEAEGKTPALPALPDSVSARLCRQEGRGKPQFPAQSGQDEHLSCALVSGQNVGLRCKGFARVFNAASHLSSLAIFLSLLERAVYDEIQEGPRTNRRGAGGHGLVANDKYTGRFRGPVLRERMQQAAQ